jgi:outer membrane protein assembly factor BamB
MYYDTGTDQVFAVDATTGKVRWSYAPPVDFLAGPSLELSEPVSRGVTYGAGRVYVTTADDQLIALDARTGKVRWRTQVVDPEAGNTMNSPGTFWHGELLVGGPAGDAGLRGFVAAYDAATGKQLWRTFMVPPPGKGWNRARGTHGGGDVWMPPTVDPHSGTAYVATGNPTPGFTNAERPGCNPSADALVALDAKTGRTKWSRTLFCPDSWDYDTVQAPLVLDEETRLNTRTMRLRGQIGVSAGDPSPITGSLVGEHLPPLGGNVVTELKPGAEAALLGQDKDHPPGPVLAQWQYGSGRVAAWTRHRRSRRGTRASWKWRRRTAAAPRSCWRANTSRRSPPKGRAR